MATRYFVLATILRLVICDYAQAAIGTRYSAGPAASAPVPVAAQPADSCVGSEPAAVSPLEVTADALASSLLPGTVPYHFVFRGAHDAGNGMIDVYGYPVHRSEQPSPLYGTYGAIMDDKVTSMPRAASLPERVVELERRLARSVLVATVAISSSTTRIGPNTTEHSETDSQSTSLVIGRNLALVTEHAMKHGGFDPEHPQCPSLTLATDDGSGLQASCGKVYYCGGPDTEDYDPKTGKTVKRENLFNDFCLVETTPLRDGSELGDHVPPLELADDRAEPSGPILSIGNPGRLGIQAEWGTAGTMDRMFQDRAIRVQAPVLGGASGSGLFDRQGRLIGMAVSGSYDSTDASRSDLILDVLWEQVKAGKIPREVYDRIHVAGHPAAQAPSAPCGSATTRNAPKPVAPIAVPAAPAAPAPAPQAQHEESVLPRPARPAM